MVGLKHGFALANSRNFLSSRNVAIVVDKKGG